MSASTEKKKRSAAVQAGTDKKSAAARLEAEKQAKSRRNWTIGSVICVVLVAAILILNSGVLYKTTAVQVGDTKYTAAELSYSYASRYQSFVNQYGSYASIFGLDTSKGLADLENQECGIGQEGQSWKDYFMEEAKEQLLQVTALCSYAAQNGITLSDEELAELDESIDQMAAAAEAYGYKNVNSFFAANYGAGVNAKVVRSVNQRTALAAKAAQTYQDSIQYTDEELEEHYQSLEGAADVFEYLSYTVNVEKVETTDADGNTSSEATDETREAAKTAAKDIELAFRSDRELADDAYEAKLDAAILQITGVEESCTHNTGVSGASLGYPAEFLMDSARKTGDTAVVENATGTGYVVVVFLGRDDNHYNTVSARHILVSVEADENGEYTDSAKAAAKMKMDMIFEDWMAGEQTEERFAELAATYSDDGGSVNNGGLYEGIYKNQMVEEFNNFCFADGRKPGDVSVVYGQSSNYEGWHLVYFVGEGELYSNMIARSDLVNEVVSTWSQELFGAYDAVITGGARYAGK
ncbi:MAG: peptidylprolyl isomerase [Oscillospiraceae bacterium]|nr:peptidylprolyl isomerase [Oscillospiraceae bacterium]